MAYVCKRQFLARALVLSRGHRLQSLSKVNPRYFAMDTSAAVKPVKGQ
jgi:hypothetical protein